MNYIITKLHIHNDLIHVICIYGLTSILTNNCKKLCSFDIRSCDKDFSIENENNVWNMVWGIWMVRSSLYRSSNIWNLYD